MTTLDEIRKRLDVVRDELLAIPALAGGDFEKGKQIGAVVGFDAAVSLLFPAVEALEFYANCPSSSGLKEPGVQSGEMAALGDRAKQVLDSIAKGKE